MAPTRRRRDTRPGPVARRFGYLIAIVLNAVFWYLIHRQPGWGFVPFLANNTWMVLHYVDVAIYVSIAVNVVLLLWDPRLVKTLGDLTTSVASLVAMVRIWQVWPFDFTGVWGGWKWLVYAGMGVGTFGVSVAILVALVAALRWRPERRPGTPRPGRPGRRP